MSVHLLIEAVAGIALATTHWLFGLHEAVWIPHFLSGIVQVVFATRKSWAHDDPHADDSLW